MIINTRLKVNPQKYLISHKIIFDSFLQINNWTYMSPTPIIKVFVFWVQSKIMSHPSPREPWLRCGATFSVVTSIIVITRREGDLIITEPRQKTLISQNEPHDLAKYTPGPGVTTQPSDMEMCLIVIQKLNHFFDNLLLN